MQRCHDAAEATDAAWQEHIATFQRTVSLLRAERDRVARGWSELSKMRGDLKKKNGGSDADDADRIEINAGGQTVTATRGTLTQLAGTRLEALFSGRWERQLQRDERGRVFLDVNPSCFRSIVDYLIELKISPPDSPPDPPHVDEEDKTYLDYLISLLGLGEALGSPESAKGVGSVGTSATDTTRSSKSTAARSEAFLDANYDLFSTKLQSALKEERDALIASSGELEKQMQFFEDEKNFIDFFVKGETKDVVHLDVCGKRMAVKRSTIGLCEDSVLAKQFNDPLWTEKPGNNAEKPSEWGCKEVVEWASKVKNLSESAVNSLKENEVTGPELLAMDRDDLKELGISRPGTIALLTRAISELNSREADRASFIEHSDYCFGKIVDQLRLKAMCKYTEQATPPPYIREPDRKRFKRIVEYYFPTECPKYIAGKEVESNILSSSDACQISTWLEEEGEGTELELLYRASRDGWTASQFHSQCDDKGATVTVVRSSEGYVFGGFADISWKSSGRNKRSPKAFLFALSCYSGLGPTKMTQEGDQTKECNWAVYHDTSCGPSFGKGLHLSVLYDTDGNACRSYFVDTSTYTRPPGQNDLFFTGEYYFKAEEIEVFHVASS